MWLNPYGLGGKSTAPVKLLNPNTEIDMKQLDHNSIQKINPNASDDNANADEILNDKLTDAMTPGFAPEFDPDEAERAGAFEEDALSEADALDSCIDSPDEG
jgi:hypothetical protein